MPSARCAASAAVIPTARRAVLKLDNGVSGLGNAIVDLAEADDPRRAIELEDDELTLDDYFAALADEGGITRGAHRGRVVRSPSVQLRLSPAGHGRHHVDPRQVLGGPHGQTYFGCHFPADPAYAERIAAEGLKVGRRLVGEGAIGRAAVDFAAVRQNGVWSPYALEINLRCGGTTHPLFALWRWRTVRTSRCSGEYRTTSSAIPKRCARRPTTSTRRRTAA